MELILNPPLYKGALSSHYAHAFEHAVELIVVSAYLTEWDSTLKLNSKCEHLRIIVGKDFGITRKSACKSLMNWLPRNRKANFLVADQIAGFHPKAVFWKDSHGKTFAIVGSSNLTGAAFGKNYEANICTPISMEEFSKARAWVNEIVKLSVPVSDDWLSLYKETAPPTYRKRNMRASPAGDEVMKLWLPRPAAIRQRIAERRKQMKEFENNKDGLLSLFRLCAHERISSSEFFEKLPLYWGGDVGGRLQGKGWDRHGKNSDFKALASSFLKVVDAAGAERDDVVVDQIDQLADGKVSTRKSFFSEMLCLYFPDRYPLLNKPVEKYLKEIKFRPAYGASEGAKYLDLAQKLRVCLARNKSYPARNLAELDTVIWEQYKPTSV